MIIYFCLVPRHQNNSACTGGWNGPSARYCREHPSASARRIVVCCWCLFEMVHRCPYTVSVFFVSSINNVLETIPKYAVWKILVMKKKTTPSRLIAYWPTWKLTWYSLQKSSSLTLTHPPGLYRLLIVSWPPNPISTSLLSFALYISLLLIFLLSPSLLSSFLSYPCHPFT